MMGVFHKEEIEKSAYECRKHILSMIHKAGSGHSGGSLGIIDILTVLYDAVLTHTPSNPQWEQRDRVVLSAGHLNPALYTVLADNNYFDARFLDHLRELDSPLKGHPELGSLPGIENTSGPLGQGVTVAVGKALAAKLQNKKWNVFCISSDGEHDEGVVWESAQFAAHHKLDNLCLIIDRNNIQIDGLTDDVLSLENLKHKYESFGWTVVEIDGHNYDLIYNALQYFVLQKSGKPFCIIAHTILGKGVSFMQGNPAWHGRAPNDAELAHAHKELDEYLRKRHLLGQLTTNGVLK